MSGVVFRGPPLVPPAPSRDDVLSFTSEPFAEGVGILGSPVAEIAHQADTQSADLYLRISDVDPDGHSRNIGDGFVRLTAAFAPLCDLERPWNEKRTPDRTPPSQSRPAFLPARRRDTRKSHDWAPR